MKFPAFISGGNVSQASTADVEQTINWYPEAVGGDGATAPRALLMSPGLVDFAEATDAPIRAQFELDGRAFAVIGGFFYELLATGVLTSRGAVVNDHLPATIRGGGDATNQLQIVAGGTLYNYNLLTDVLTIVASGGTDNVQGDYLDGYFLKLDTSSTFAISDLLDNTVYDPLQIAQRLDAPDKWSALKVIGKFIILPGSETTSALYDAGAFPFPFQLVPGVLINQGIAAPFSLVDLNGAAAWIAQSRDGDRQIVRMVPQQWTVERISTPAVEYALSQYATVADAVGMVFQYQGHWFYHLNFPTANDSQTFDASTGQWVQFLYWNATLGEWEAWRGQYHCFAFGSHLVGDRSLGTIYQLSGTTYTDAGGVALRRVRRCPFPRVLESADYVNCSQIQILMDVGIGLTEGDPNDPPVLGSDPQVMLRISRDAGKTWGDERTAPAGKLGAYSTRVMWQRNGRWRDGRGVLEISVSEPVPWRMVDAEFEVVKGAP